MVEHQLPKLVTRVRFPPGAPNVKLALDLRGFFVFYGRKRIKFVSNLKGGVIYVRRKFNKIVNWRS